MRNVTQSLAHIFNQQALSKRPLLLRCCAKYLKTRLWGPGWEVGIIMSHQRRFSFEFQGITRKGHQYPRVETSENEGLWKIWLNVYSFHRSSPVHLEMLFFIMFLPDGKKKKDSSLYAFKLVFRPHDRSALVRLGLGNQTDHFPGKEAKPINKGPEWKSRS